MTPHRDTPALVCLPPAGSGAGIFRDWQRDDQTIIAPTLPGREARFREAMPDSLTALADLIADDLAPTLPQTYGMFGYSMGGTLAVLLAERLVARGFPQPRVVFTLGALAPDRLNSGVRKLHTLSSPEFWDEIARIGGTPDEILEDADLRALFEPMLRQDFALCHGHRHPGDGFRLDCPVHVYLAENDHLVGPESVTDWARFTTGTTHDHRLVGGHMLDPGALRDLRVRLRSLWPLYA